jgi:hypothetical protein
MTKAASEAENTRMRGSHCRNPHGESLAIQHFAPVDIRYDQKFTEK